MRDINIGFTDRYVLKISVKIRAHPCYPCSSSCCFASVLVTKNGKLTGIISMEDIMGRGAAKAGVDIVADEVMHSPEITRDSDKWIMNALRCSGAMLII